MKRIFQPSLARRVIFGLGGSFLVIWVALVAYSYKANADRDTQLTGAKQFGEFLAQSMEHVQTPLEAKGLAQGLVEVQNKIFELEKLPFLLAIQLRDASGQLIYAGPTPEMQQLHGLNRSLQTENIQGREYWVYRAELPQWTVVVARSEISTRWLLTTIAIEILPFLFIAFLLNGVFVWFAVKRGLRPLQDMSHHIAARKPDDLSATGLSVKYAELLPLQQALDKLLTKLRHKVDAEAAFVQEAAHELRTPMAVVSAQAHVLRMAQDPTERQEAEQHLDAALARASHLVGQLLQLAQVGGERALVLAPLDLAQDVASDLAALVPSAMQRNIELALDAPDSLVVAMERQTFKSILHNLVGNAIRYVQEGGKVEVSLALQGADIVLAVTDNGPGIPADQHELVFERFHRGGDHAASGVGLGLAIVRQACKRLGGTVTLGSGLQGAGCQFVVRIPSRV